MESELIKFESHLRDAEAALRDEIFSKLLIKIDGGNVDE